MFNPRSIYQVIGVMLFLIALFLVLDKYTGATRVITAVAQGGKGLVRVLQGRG